MMPNQEWVLARTTLLVMAASALGATSQSSLTTGPPDTMTNVQAHNNMEPPGVGALRNDTSKSSFGDINTTGLINDTAVPNNVTTRPNDVTDGKSDATTTFTPMTSTTKLTSVTTTKTTESKTTATSTTRTLRPLSERECIPGLECLHGFCIFPTFTCACDTGWGGAFCSIPCPLHCGTGGTCIVREGKRPYCDCDDGPRTGPCTDSEQTSTTPLNGTSTTTTTSSSTVGTAAFTMATTDDGVILDVWKPLDGYGPLRPLELRACKPGFVCRYGNCSQEGKIECICEAGFTDLFCHRPCPLDCGEHGKCEFSHVNNTPECACVDPRFTGFNCSRRRPIEEEDNPSLWWTVGASAAVVVVLVLLLVVLPYLLWRRRNVTMMKIVYWFQGFEEDDDRQYDAFVSYASADHDCQFVLHNLVPTLEEQLCFSLCVHQRNFIPGRYITDNIAESVKKSRRTLLIISPSFISSGWCKFEYQMALQEMLNQKHRILPILIEDITSLKQDMDETLKSILNTVTWLEYPGKNSTEQELDKFWKRLALSMPKRRSNQTETSPGSSYSVSPSSSQSIISATSKERPEPLSLSPGSGKRKRLQVKQCLSISAYDLESADERKSRSRLCPTFSKIFGRSGNSSSQSTGASIQSFSQPESPPPAYSETMELQFQNACRLKGDHQSQKVTPSINNCPTSKSNTAQRADIDVQVSILDSFLGDQSLGSGSHL